MLSRMTGTCHGNGSKFLAKPFFKTHAAFPPNIVGSRLYVTTSWSYTEDMGLSCPCSVALHFHVLSESAREVVELHQYCPEAPQSRKHQLEVNRIFHSAMNRPIAYVYIYIYIYHSRLSQSKNRRSTVSCELRSSVLKKNQRQKCAAIIVASTKLLVDVQIFTRNCSSTPGCCLKGILNAVEGSIWRPRGLPACNHHYRRHLCNT